MDEEALQRFLEFLQAAGDKVSGAREQVGTSLRGLMEDPSGTIAQGFRDTLQDPATDFAPGLGDIKGLMDAPGLFREGRTGAGLLSLAGALPMIPGGIARFRKPMIAAAEAGDTRRAAGLLEELQAARDIPLGTRAHLDAPIKGRGGTFTLFDDAGDALPGKATIEVGRDGVVDVRMPVDPASLEGANTIGRRGVRDVGRQIINAVEAAGHKVKELTGFRGSGARGPFETRDLSVDQNLTLPRSFFFR